MLPMILVAVTQPPSLSTPPGDPGTVQVRSQSFIYATGSVHSWTNLLSDRQFDLGTNPEVELEIGERPESAVRVSLRLVGKPEIARKNAQAILHYRSLDDSLSATVTLKVDSKFPILHKFVEVSNVGDKPLRLLNVVLGRYPVGDAKTEGGDRGFPLYLDGQFFMSLTHPAGFSQVEGQEIVLRQYPGTKLAPGQKFACMEAVYGVAKPGEARKLFVSYARSRMARVKYGHVKPYAIFEAFGGQPEGDFKENFALGVSASYLLRNLADIKVGQEANGAMFDFYSIEFWHERAGDLKEFSRANFPSGFAPVRKAILDVGMKPGLWIDSGRLPDWTIDKNPLVKSCYTVSDGVGGLCRASEPIEQMYKDAFIYQMRENKVGLLKFDNLAPVCVNPAHHHLPGPLYSTEAIYSSLIDFFETLRRANPDVFLMLYWGYRSPWWLQYGDTYFECGDQIEAASPAQYPTPYARDAVTQRLDQAQLNITDTPWIGKDSLGVWLSDWTWNSGVGKTRWQEGVIMDMARGGMLFQMWTDENWLTPPERSEVVTFINLMKANPACFDHSRFILGNPNNAEPYGYSCCDGKKAFLAVSNACLKDSVVSLSIGPEYGLPASGKWDVYRWYPSPKKQVFAGDRLSIAMRPYEVVLLEVVPRGSKPSLGRAFDRESTPLTFAEATQSLPVAVMVHPVSTDGPTQWSVVKPVSFESAKGASLSVLADGSVLASGPNLSNDTTVVTLRSDVKAISGFLLEMLPDASLPGNGPGRAENGNFALCNVRVQVAPFDHPEQVRDVKIRSAVADFSQLTFNGWPVSAAIDNDPRSGWSIHPEVGISHVAAFTFDQPVSGLFTVTLSQGDNHHNLGRFRFSVTSDVSPRLPEAYEPAKVTLTVTLPATKTGGLLLLTGGTSSDVPLVLVDGLPLSVESVWAQVSNWSCPWTAWRAVVGPSVVGRQVVVTMLRKRLEPSENLGVHFLPK